MVILKSWLQVRNTGAGVEDDKMYQLPGPNASENKLESQGGIQALFISYPGGWVGCVARIKNFPSRMLEKITEDFGQ